MENIDRIKDNRYMEENEEYIDQEIIIDNDDGHNLERIAHKVQDDAPNLSDVGASYREEYFKILNAEYRHLSPKEMQKVVEIIEENY